MEQMTRYWPEPEILKANLSSNLICYLHKNRMSFMELSDMIGVNRLTIRGWVNSVALPRMEHIHALSQVSGVGIEEWITDGGVK